MSDVRWVTVVEDLSGLRQGRLKKELEASRLDWRIREERGRVDLQVALDAHSESALSVLRQMLASYEALLQAAVSEGIRLRPYKPLEEEQVVLAAERAMADAGEDVADLSGKLLHELVWAQGLPNANHRCTFALIERVIRQRTGIKLDPEHVRRVAERFADKSKPLILDKEFLPDPAENKRRHQAISLEHARILLGRN